MSLTELNSFIQKFHQLWNAGHKAQFDLNCHGLVYEYSWEILLVPIIKYTLLLIVRNSSHHHIKADVSNELLHVKTLNVLRKHLIRENP